eukprot:EG_transcript_5953
MAAVALMVGFILSEAAAWGSQLDRHTVPAARTVRLEVPRRVGRPSLHLPSATLTLYPAAGLPTADEASLSPATQQGHQLRRWRAAPRRTLPTRMPCYAVMWFISWGLVAASTLFALLRGFALHLRGPLPLGSGLRPPPLGASPTRENTHAWRLCGADGLADNPLVRWSGREQRKQQAKAAKAERRRQRQAKKRKLFAPGKKRPRGQGRRAQKKLASHTQKWVAVARACHSNTLFATDIFARRDTASRYVHLRFHLQRLFVVLYLKARVKGRYPGDPLPKRRTRFGRLFSFCFYLRDADGRPTVPAPEDQPAVERDPAMEYEKDLALRSRRAKWWHWRRRISRRPDKALILLRLRPPLPGYETWLWYMRRGLRQLLEAMDAFVAENSWDNLHRMKDLLWALNALCDSVWPAGLYRRSVVAFPWQTPRAAGPYCGWCDLSYKAEEAAAAPGAQEPAAAPNSTAGTATGPRPPRGGRAKSPRPLGLNRRLWEPPPALDFPKTTALEEDRPRQTAFNPDWGVAEVGTTAKVGDVWAEHYAAARRAVADETAVWRAGATLSPAAWRDASQKPQGAQKRRR